MLYQAFGVDGNQAEDLTKQETDRRERAKIARAGEYAIKLMGRTE